MITTPKKSGKEPEDEKFILHAVPGDNSGEVELLWQPVPEARSYVIQISSGLTKNKLWRHADIVTRSRYTASGLKSGRNYSFRIAPITNSGQQSWSHFVTQKAA